MDIEKEIEWIARTVYSSIRVFLFFRKIKKLKTENKHRIRIPKLFTIIQAILCHLLEKLYTKKIIICILNLKRNNIMENFLIDWVFWIVFVDILPSKVLPKKLIQTYSGWLVLHWFWFTLFINYGFFFLLHIEKVHNE